MKLKRNEHDRSNGEFPNTLPKFNIAPQRLPSQKESSILTIHFSGAMFNFGGVCLMHSRHFVPRLESPKFSRFVVSCFLRPFRGGIFRLQGVNFPEVYMIPWVWPPPRMPVTTRSITWLLGNPNLNLHFCDCYWVGVDLNDTKQLQCHPISCQVKSLELCR